MRGKFAKLTCIVFLVLIVFLLQTTVFAMEETGNASLQSEKKGIKEGFIGILDAEPSNSEILDAPSVLASVTLTSADDLIPLIPDNNLRTVVYNALVDEGITTGADFGDILGQFRGTLRASNKGITDIRGLQYLINAEEVILSKNLIADWTVLSPSGTFSKDHYGSVGGGGVTTTNVYWTIFGNPFENLPMTFGGRLVIYDLSTHSYVYPQDEDINKYFIRKQAGEVFSTDLDVGRCKIMGDLPANNDGVLNGYIRLLEKSSNVVGLTAKGSNVADNSVAYTHKLLGAPKELNRYFEIGGIIKNANLRVGIGTDQIIHYETADEEIENDNITPGSKSYKYYLFVNMNVYDKISLTHHNTGSASIVKTDSTTGKTLMGAQYSLYKDGKEIQTGLTTDKNGRVLVKNLTSGNYSFVETQAPDGFLKDSTPVTFSVKDPVNAHGSVTGGVAKEGEIVEDSKGQKASPGFDELFILGKGSPDVALNVTPLDAEISIIVAYSALAQTDSEQYEENVERVFTNAADAQADINNMKNENRIAGPISIDVGYAPHSSVTQANDPIPTPTPSPSATPSPSPTPLPSQSAHPTPTPFMQPTVTPTQVPTQTSQQEKVDEQEAQTVEKSPKTNDGTNLLLYTILLIAGVGVICIIMLYLYKKTLDKRI